MNPEEGKSPANRLGKNREKTFLGHIKSGSIKDFIGRFLRGENPELRKLDLENGHEINDSPLDALKDTYSKFDDDNRQIVRDVMEELVAELKPNEDPSFVRFVLKAAFYVKVEGLRQTLEDFLEEKTFLSEGGTARQDIHWVVVHLLTQYRTDPHIWEPSKDTIDTIREDLKSRYPGKVLLLYMRYIGLDEALDSIDNVLSAPLDENRAEDFKGAVKKLANRDLDKTISALQKNERNIPKLTQEEIDEIFRKKYKKTVFSSE